ncbi:hypothetical protein PHISCL_01677 [Aspergillus sclerotialis]|uniref:DUF4048 domain-containing protein n=1 Tax=Aspergillus sclerotialis TaxID=2070753 RepID=A0A3A2ZS41_9EURO|nr:hypothetical protein PHISCL_01677 [Aspergillus sclerotialis]
MEDFSAMDDASPSVASTGQLPPSISQPQTQTQLKRSSLPPRPHGTARHSKRLTLNFPINVPTPDSDPSSSSPGSMTPVHSSRQSPALPAGTPGSFEEQDDGNNLLTAIASQERKVLELREELQNAETELATLKKQWTLSEKTRKRAEINYHAEPLLPLKSPEHPTSDNISSHRRERSLAATDSPAASARPSRELDRRHSMRAAAAAGSTVSANGRRVFQGSHARTLSLLSAASDSAYKKPVSDLEQGKSDNERISRVPRAATLPSVERSTDTGLRTGEPNAEDGISPWRKNVPPPSREALMRTGRQMASDLREGLWTFLEDIRQATVGEEGINATETRGLSPSPSAAALGSRKRDSSSNSRSRDRDRLSVQGEKTVRSPQRGSGTTTTTGKETKSTDIDASFWNEFGIDTSGQKSPQLRDSANTPRGPAECDSSLDVDADDSWDVDAWDTPQPQQQSKNTHTPSSSRSTLESKQQSPATQVSSPRTSASFGDWNPALSTIPDPSVSDGIPWPAITKLAPSKLARTASNLMDEWERSLSPSPERRGSPQPGKDDKKD